MNFRKLRLGSSSCGSRLSEAFPAFMSFIPAESYARDFPDSFHRYVTPNAEIAPSPASQASHISGSHALSEVVSGVVKLHPIVSR
eukprot:1483582-Amphidinium_carterae.1